MANSILQPTFSGGELSPSLWGRSDLARYANSLKTCRNFIVKRQGGIDNRPGTKFVAAAKYPDRKCRLIEFEFNTEQTYVLELGHLYFRIFRDGFAITSGGQPVEVETPYSEEHLFDINFVQSADVMTLVHPDVPPQEIRRLADDNWQMVPFASEIGPFRDANLNAGRTITASGVTGTVTLTANTGIFSAALVGTDVRLEQVDTGDVSAWMNRTAVELGDLRYVDERVYEAVELADGADVITGDNTPVHTEGDKWDGPRTTAQGITEVLGVKWRYLHSGFGVVRITSVTNSTTAVGTVTRRLPSAVVDNGTYKYSLSAWDSQRGYPRAVTYYQQRLVFAGSRAQPQSFWMSETGIFDGFGTSMPLEPTDAISYTIASRQINEIRHLVTLQSLLAMTSGAEWTINAGAEGLAADTLSVEPQNYRGVSNVAPLVVGSSVLYIQRRSRAIRDLGYSFEVDGFTGEDLTLLSSHLFEKFRLTDWGFIQTPYSAAFCVRNDGTLLTMTYLKDQQVLAWARHDTDGEYESVATIAEGDEDYAYFVVKRQINGQTVRYIERMESRLFDDVEDAFFVDSGLTYDGRNTSTTTVRLTGGTNWEYPEVLSLNATASIFTPASVGRTYRLRSGDDYALLDVTEYVSGTQVSVRTRRFVPESLRSVQTTQWALMASTISGLDHLKGKTVSILADGNVEPPRVVQDGAIELQFPAAVVHAGLGYESDMETLAMSAQMQNGTTLRDNQKLVSSVSLQVEASRGIFIGQSQEDADVINPEWLNEYKQRDDENWGEPTQLATGLIDVKTNSVWDSEASVFVRQSDPLPLSVQGMIIKVTNGGKR